MKIESLDQDIRTLLSSGYYKIPRFQRPYSWSRENIQEFWDDVVRDNPEDYFIGSMVVFKESNQRFGVVDGQQRLTTIMILLARLLKAQLARNIAQVVEKKGWTQTQTAQRTAVDQPKVSRLLRGQLSGFSADRLFAILNRLGHSVEVRISKKERPPAKAWTRLKLG